MPAELRGAFEQSLGSSLDRVRLHTDAGAARMTDAMHARAVTVGDDIHFAAHEYRPGSTPGAQLLAHEMVHVAQQRGAGGSRASTSALEAEADALAPRVMRGVPVHPSSAAAVAPAAKPRGSDDRPRPLGLHVAELLVTQAPALLPLVPAERIEALQQRFDTIASNADVNARANAVAQAFQREYNLPWSGHGDTRRAVERIQDELRPVPDGPETIALDAASVLAPDILEPQPRNQVAETTFRKKIYDQLVAAPMQLEILTILDPPRVVLRSGGLSLPHTNGRVTFADLTTGRGPFAAAYDAEVRNGPEVRELRGAIDGLESEVSRIRDEHEDLSTRNAQHPIVRRVAGFFGGPSMHEVFEVIADAKAHPEKGTVEQRLEMLDPDYPVLAIWNAPQTQIAEASELLTKREVELALIAFMRAQHAAMSAAQRFSAYERKQMKGAGIAIQWLERLKTAGKIAAGVASGGLGLVGQAGVAASYAFTQEGAQQLSEVGHGLRSSVDFGALAKQAALEGAMSFLGGLTQGAFQKTLTARFGPRLVEKFGPVVSERILSAGASLTSSFYTAPANAVLGKIIAGGPMPKSLEELADMVVDEAAQGVVMDVFLGTVTHVAQGGKQTPTAPGADETPLRIGEPSDTADSADPRAKRADEPAAKPPEPAQHASTSSPFFFGLPFHPPAAAPPPKHPIVDLAAKADASPRHADDVIDYFGSWESAIGHLSKSTGHAALLDAPARQRLIDALVSRRNAIVGDLARFGAKPVDSASVEHGSDVDLNVGGENAGLQVVQATAHLDANHPGWQKRFRMSVMVEADRTRQMGAALGALPASTRREISRRQTLATEAYLLVREARGASSPEARAELLGRIGDPELRKRAEWLAGLDADAARAERNRLLVHGDRAVAAIDPRAPVDQRVRQIEEAMDAQMVANALDPEAYLSPGAIRGVVLGESLAPNARYQAVVEQIGMIGHAVSEAGGVPSALRKYETFKYVQRICDQLQAAGIKDPRITFLTRQSELVYRVDRSAAASSAERSVSAADLGSKTAKAAVRYDDLGAVQGVSDQYLGEVYGMLKDVVRDHVPTLRKSALGPSAAGAEGPPIHLPELTSGSTTASQGGPAAGAAGPAHQPSAGPDPASPSNAGQAPPTTDTHVAARAATPDGEHEISILKDGRIVRCSRSCRELRTHFDEFLRGPVEPWRRREAEALDARLVALEQRARANASTDGNAIARDTAALEVELRRFAAETMAKSLGIGAKPTARLLEAFDPAQVRQLGAELGPEGLRRMSVRGDPTAKVVVDSLELAAGSDGARGFVVAMLRRPAAQLPADALRRGLEDLNAFMRQHPEALTNDLLGRMRSAVDHDDVTTMRNELRNATDIAEGRVPRLLLPGQEVQLPSGGAVRRESDGSTRIEQPLGPGQERRGYEESLLPAVEVGLDGWHRAHSQGAGTGAESRAGILYAPPKVNLDLQNSGIEARLRTLVKQKAMDVTFHLVTVTKAHPGTRRLASIEYLVVAERNGQRTPVFEATIEVQDSRNDPRTHVTVSERSPVEPFLK